MQAMQINNQNTYVAKSDFKEAMSQLRDSDAKQWETIRTLGTQEQKDHSSHEIDIRHLKDVIEPRSRTEAKKSL